MTRAPENPDRELFLPDFCDMRMVFAVVVVGELLAIILTLNPMSSRPGGFPELAFASLFVQWVALGSAGALCVCRRPLARLGNTGAATVSYLLILTVTLGVSEAAYWIVMPQMSDPALATVWEFSFGEDGLGPARPVSTVMSHGDFVVRNVGIAAVVGLVVLRYFYVQHQWKARMESESRARIQALQSRIRPHFLFNSMNTIASLARSEPALAEQVTEDLAALFRVSLGDASVPGTLAQELEVCRQYLRIESQRLGERLASDGDTDALPGDALLPALTLQPLVENAVYHGVEPAPDGGHIRVDGRLEGERILVSVENSVPRSGAAAARAGNAMALDNVRQRMEAFFAGDSRFKVVPGDGLFRVELEFPYRKTSP